MNVREVTQVTDSPVIELTILMPCLNEAETVGTCVRKAREYLSKSGISGEVVVADNGSTDGSQEIAQSLGARVVPIPERGYGAALIGGINAAYGKFVIMGDADDSYDFSQLNAFVARLREGYDLVMGNRFKGGIVKGAMPPLHRWLGNPILSFLGRTFFKIQIGDFHCGLRGFNAQAIRALSLRSVGMEFASEMIVRSSLAGMRITEVPTTLKKDGRSRPPHLRTWQDGWRHLRFLLMFAPRWLFFYPGVALLTLGIVSSLLLLPGPFYITPKVGLDFHTFLVGAFSTLIGMQCISFSIIVRRYAATRYLPRMSPTAQRVLAPLTLERVLSFALFLALAGGGGMIWCFMQWADEHFGPLQYDFMIKVLTISITGVALALQLAFTAFLSAIIEKDI